MFEAPEYVIRGKRKYDQDWIDGNIEAGVGACDWQRPKARPASIDGAPSQRSTAQLPPKKKSFFKRVPERVSGRPAWPLAATSPVLVQAQPPSPAPVVSAPSTPRDPVDELLSPSVR